MGHNHNQNQTEARLAYNPLLSYPTHKTVTMWRRAVIKESYLNLIYVVPSKNPLALFQNFLLSPETTHALGKTMN